MKGLRPAMPYQGRVRETETAKRQIQEFLIAELRELLSPEHWAPDPERIEPRSWS